jgi:hypothetical protein
LWAHWRERNALIPVGAFQPQHDLLGVAGETELSEDLAQILMALGKRSVEPLHAVLPGVDAQPLDQPEPDIRVGQVASAAAIGREHDDILLGFAAAPDRLGCCTHAALAVDEGRHIAPAALQQAAQGKPHLAMRVCEHRLVIKPNLAARLAPQCP